MLRREFLVAGAASLCPLSAIGQQNANIRRVGFLTSASQPRSIETSYLTGFPHGMRELGYVEGKDYILEWRFAAGRVERFREFAAQLVHLKVDVIVLGTPTALPAVLHETSSIPVVLGYSTDPVGAGFIASLASPGGNVTGLASSQEDAAPKQVELLTTAIPNLSRVGLIVDGTSPNSIPITKQAQAAALAAGLRLVQTEVQSSNDVELAFARLRTEGASAVMVATGSISFFNRERIGELALKNGLPSIFSLREFVTAGGLMSYGESLFDFHRRAAAYVDKILKGARPAALPVEQPTRLFLVINRKTADALSLTIPPTFFARADEMIE